MKLLILTTTYDHHDKIWSRICELGFSFDSVGTEYNCVLGLELYRTFRPDLVIFNAAMSSIPFSAYIELCRSYYPGARFLVLCAQVHPSPVALAGVIGYMAFDDIFTDTFADLLKKSRAAVLASPAFKPARKYLLLVRPHTSLTLSQSPQFLQELATTLEQYGVEDPLYESQHLRIRVSGSPEEDYALSNLMQEIANHYRQHFNTGVTFLLSVTDSGGEGGTEDSVSAGSGKVSRALRLSYFFQEKVLIRVEEFHPEIHPAAVDIGALIFQVYDAFCDHRDLAQVLRSWYKSHLKHSCHLLSCARVHSALAALYLSLSALIGTPDYGLFASFETIEEEYRQIAAALTELSEVWEQRARDRNPILLKAVVYICAHYQEPLTLRQCAAACSSSETYVSYLFKSKFIARFSDYLNQLRIRTALLLLKSDPEEKISAIALASGFSDYHYFSQLFKKYTGKTVSELRALSLAESGEWI